MTEQRVYNFSAGPATLPLPVLEEARRNLLALQGVGMSVLEISHRSKTFVTIRDQSEEAIRTLLAIPDDYRVLFLQGGATLQFAMVPMNLLAEGESADYILTGAWGKKALAEARKLGKTRVAANTEEGGFHSLPKTIDLQADSAYVHYTANETIGGVEWPAPPDSRGVPLVADASSNFLSRPMDVASHGLIYAGAQKNAGPAGVTIVIIRKDLLDRTPAGLPAMLDYRLQAEKKSAYNTPPVFAIYIVGLVAKWVLDRGGIKTMAKANEAKASLLYQAIDASDGFYRGHADPGCRSRMNVTFRLPTKDLEEAFAVKAASENLVGLRGHRSVGGLRASIYNAFPKEGVERLVDLMDRFRKALA